jgi:UDPglucose 6-dehydrogenase
MERFKIEYPDLNVVCCKEANEVLEEADALVLVTEWQQYRELPWEELMSTMRSPIVLDGRHTLDRARLTRFGYKYVGIAG